MTGNFPNLVKEIDIPVQEVQSPKQAEPKEAHTMIHHYEMPKIKDKDNLKSS